MTLLSGISIIRPLLSCGVNKNVYVSSWPVIYEFGGSKMTPANVYVDCIGRVLSRRPTKFVMLGFTVGIWYQLAVPGGGAESLVHGSRCRKDGAPWGAGVAAMGQLVGTSVQCVQYSYRQENIAPDEGGETGGTHLD